uniref:Ovule protein n=1 Tax=Panagrellus redivivus TaxID=6233 RepID=A0A7E4VQY2_PANRE
MSSSVSQLTHPQKQSFSRDRSFFVPLLSLQFSHFLYPSDLIARSGNKTPIPLRSNAPSIPRDRVLNLSALAHLFNYS